MPLSAIRTINACDGKKFHCVFRELQGVTEDHAFIAGKRCLVLEDEFLIALDIQQALEAAGASVTCVGDAEQALKALHEGAKFDFAVLDFKLSGRTRNSMTVAALLAEQGTPFVFLTGMRVDDVQGQSFPNVPVVEKPYLVETLMEALRKVLGVNDEPDRAA